MKWFKNIDEYNMFGLSQMNGQMPPRAEFEEMLRARRAKRQG